MVIADASKGIRSVTPTRYGWQAAFVAICLVAITAFTALPGTIEGKSLAVLHGLCAQQPTHSYYFGEARLPFDARMTGIYGGFAFVTIFLALRGRWRNAASPGLAVFSMLVLLIMPLAMDGANSLLKDLQLPYLYEPRNAVRTLTGLMVGMSLGTFVWLLVGQTAFRPSRRTDRQIWNGSVEFLFGLGMLVGIAALLGYSALPLRLPLTYLLLVSAVIAVMGLLLPFVLLVTRSEQRAATMAELARPATLALLLAFVFIGLLSGGRFFLELVLGVSSSVPA